MHCFKSGFLRSSLLFILMLTASSMAGCNATRGPDRGDTIVPLHAEIHDELSGVYENGRNQGSTVRGFQLISMLIYDDEMIDSYVAADRIKLSARPDGLLVQFELDGHADEVFLEGRYQDGYLRLDKQRKLKGLPPLLYGYGTQAVRVGRLKTGELVVDRTAGGCLFLVALPLFCGGGHTYSNSYTALVNNESGLIEESSR